MKGFLKTYVPVFAIGGVLTKLAMMYTTAVRGSSTEVGGELLILPGIVFLVFMYQDMKADGMFEPIEDDEDDDDEYEDEEDDC
jgi:hypothetical protein